MQLKAERDPLLDGLQTAARALSTRTTLPSLGGVMLVGAGGKAVARATDGELAISVELEAEVDGDGEILLPGMLLTNVARALPPGTVTLTERREQRDVELTAGTANFHLRLLDPEDFPRLPEASGELLRMPAAALAETVERVRSGPPRFPWRIKKLRLLINLNEYFVHHEDVRRANGMTRRTDRPDLDDALWSIMSRAGAMSARKLKPFGLEVRRPEGAAVVLRNAEKVAVLTGHPSEIALYLFGRRGAADVQISGDAEATAKLRQAQLGI